MKSTIDARHGVPNRNRRFGAATRYYPATVRRLFVTRRALFTEDQIREAELRYNANPEDWPKPKILQLWAFLVAKLKGLLP